MQHVPALARVAFSIELGVARHAPDVGRHVVLGLENLLRLDCFGQDRPAPEELRTERPVGLRRGAVAIQPLQDAVHNARRHRRHGVLLVHHRQVVEDAFLFDVHPADTVLDDDGDLVGKCRVVADAVGIDHREELAVSVLVLQPFAGERGAAGGPPEEEAARARIAGGPDQVAYPLEAEHRVIDEERDRVDAVRRVGGARRDERRHRSGFRDPFLENLAVGGFLVIEERIHVDRLVHLPGVRVDADLAEQRLHAERPGFVRHDRHDEPSQLFVAQHLRQQPHEHHGRRGLAAFGALVELLEELARNGRERFAADLARRHEAAEPLAPLAHVANLDAVGGGPVERRFADVRI